MDSPPLCLLAAPAPVLRSAARRIATIGSGVHRRCHMGHSRQGVFFSGKPCVGEPGQDGDAAASRMGRVS